PPLSPARCGQDRPGAPPAIPAYGQQPVGADLLDDLVQRRQQQRVAHRQALQLGVDSGAEATELLDMRAVCWSIAPAIDRAESAGSRARNRITLCNQCWSAARRK